MKVVNPEQVEQVLAKWQLPLQFTPLESNDLHKTMFVVNNDRILAFPTPAANQGLNILKLREFIGVDPARPPSFS